jgi:aminoglycoside phosphotransferase (APT) family kinase protein
MSFRPDPVPQDWAAIARWLEAAGLHLDLTMAPRQFAGGLANLNYLVRIDGAPAVFRRPPGGSLAHGASDMAREARVLGALNPVFPLAPRALAFCNDRAVIGVDFQLLEYRSGIAIGGTLPDSLSAADAGWLIDALVGALAQLHALEPEAQGLAGLGKATGFAERQLNGWGKRADAAFGAEAPPALAPLLARLGDTVPPDAPARLLHMDAKFDNLLVDLKSRRATALIDWDMGTLGAPAFDLAVLLSYWIEPGGPAETHALGAVPSLTPGFPRRTDVVAAYARAAGAVPPDLAWHLALARLRLATAWMQLYRLWQQGALVGDRYAGFADLAAAILAQALDSFGDSG